MKKKKKTIISDQQSSNGTIFKYSKYIFSHQCHLKEWLSLIISISKGIRDSKVVRTLSLNHFCPFVDTIKIDMWVKFVVAGCKENHFYSLPFEQAEASIYQPRRHFNWPQKRFVLLLFKFLIKHHLPVGQVKNRIHQPDSKIYQPRGYRTLLSFHAVWVLLSAPRGCPKRVPQEGVFL